MTGIKIIFTLFFIVGGMPAFAGALVSNAEQIYEVARITCSGISDEIAEVAKISKANTVVTAVGTATAGGALVAGIEKSQYDKEIDDLVQQICNAGGCNLDTVRLMERGDFLSNVIVPMSRIVELTQLKNNINKSKTAGNWRTGLMIGTVGTNLASAIMSGLKANQSELVQHIVACNDAVSAVKEAELSLKRAGVNPMEEPIMRKLGNVKTWCNNIDIKDIEKIEKRMKGIMGTSIAGTAIGAVGVGTSAAANSDKYMNYGNKLMMSDQDRKTEHALNVTSNVMAGANVATGAVETGLNISLITLTKKLMESAQRCEEMLL